MGYEDFRTKRIRDLWILVLVVLGIPVLKSVSEISLLQRVAGFFIISIPLLTIACMMKRSIGGGDIKLMAAGGVLLGAQNIWNAFVIGILTAGCWVSILMAVRRADRKTEIALGPFLCLGMAWVILRI